MAKNSHGAPATIESTVQRINCKNPHSPRASFETPASSISSKPPFSPQTQSVEQSVEHSLNNHLPNHSQSLHNLKRSQGAGAQSLGDVFQNLPFSPAPGQRPNHPCVANIVRTPVLVQTQPVEHSCGTIHPTTTSRITRKFEWNEKACRRQPEGQARRRLAICIIRKVPAAATDHDHLRFDRSAHQLQKPLPNQPVPRHPPPDSRHSIVPPTPLDPEKSSFVIRHFPLPATVTRLCLGTPRRACCRWRA